MKSDYIPQNDDAFNVKLQLFKNAIGAYAAVIGASTAQITAQAADAAYFEYIILCANIMSKSALQWTGWKGLARVGGALPASGAPVVPPNFPVPVPAVAPGIEARFRALAKLIKANPGYNEGIGLALGIESAQQAVPDLTTVQPVLGAGISGNHVRVKWGWGGYGAFLDLCELQVDRGEGNGFGPLAFDLTPGYTDKQAFPAAPVVWTYRAIYHVGESQVGLWSLPVSLTVPG
ncbi:MAG TPA: hypothetical protein VIK59_07505 [Verrucomicrobiae bacterium]